MTTISMIEAIKTYIATYTGLVANAPIWVNYLGTDPTQYTIIPLPGACIVETYLDDSALCEFPFAFQSVESTADELERLESIGFFEAFAAWLKSQTAADTFPTLNAGQTPERIEALTWGYLYQQGESATGIYQITCKLTYKQQP